MTYRIDCTYADVAEGLVAIERLKLCSFCFDLMLADEVAEGLVAIERVGNNVGVEWGE
jgi:hypothetical protein